MLSLFFFADFGCFGVELPQNNGVQFFCPLKSQKLHCILYQSGRNKTGPLLGVFICFLLLIIIAQGIFIQRL